MDILVLTPDYPPSLYGGIGTYVYNLYKNFTNDSITVFVAPFGRTVANVTSIANVTSSCTKNQDIILCNVMGNKFSFKNQYYLFWASYNEILFDKIVSFMDRTGKRFDILHANGSYFALLADALRSKYGMKVVYTKHGINDYPLDQDYVADLFLSLHSDYIVCPSKWISDEIKRIYPEVTTPKSVIPNGVSLMSGLITMQGKQKIILYCGRLSYSKGCDILLNAISVIQEFLRDRKFRVIVIGDGPEKENLLKMSKALQIFDLVCFKGAMVHEEVIKWMCEADICVIPSRKEGFGLVALEAMSCGCCVIASNTGGLKEIIHTNVNGLLFNGSHYPALSECIERVIEDSLFKMALKQNASTFVRQFPWSNTADKMRRVYELLCP
jgi:glycosyltransferase involved in cell wall biosynthesis